MFNAKYVRIQGRRISRPTGKPGGIFALGFWQIQDGVFNEDDAKIYNNIHKWFEDNLPNPPQYENGNPMRVITYFKTECSENLIIQLMPLIKLLDKHSIAYDVVYTNQVGKIVYEDDYQVAVVDE